MRISAEAYLIATTHVVIIRAVASIGRAIPIYLTPIIVITLNEASRFRLFNSEVLSFLRWIFYRLTNAFRTAFFNFFLERLAMDRPCINIFKRRESSKATLSRVTQASISAYRQRWYRSRCHGDNNLMTFSDALLDWWFPSTKGGLFPLKSFQRVVSTLGENILSTSLLICTSFNAVTTCI